MGAGLPQVVRKGATLLPLTATFAYPEVLHFSPIRGVCLVFLTQVNSFVISQKSSEYAFGFPKVGLLNLKPPIGSLLSGPSGFNVKFNMKYIRQHDLCHGSESFRPGLGLTSLL